MLFDPAEATHFSPMQIDLYCFPSKLERQPSRYQNFEAQSHSLFSRCLRLATTITGSHPRLATGGWLDLTRQAFHLLDYSPLSGRTIPVCISVCFKNGQSLLELPTHLSLQNPTALPLPCFALSDFVAVTSGENKYSLCSCLFSC